MELPVGEGQRQRCRRKSAGKARQRSVEGPIVRYADLFTEISGATSIETLAQDLHSALNDNTISGIVLNIDSPGGEVNGTSEFADMVHGIEAERLHSYSGTPAELAARLVEEMSMEGRREIS